jgi:multicomponent Na+:H+ antiporter subunit D
LSTYPLVVHRGTPEALRAGKVYLIYTLTGGVILLAGVAWLRALAGPLDFTETGILAGRTDLNPATLKIIFVLLIAGLGVKAALVPLHGWLPKAMVAPAPVSSLLHAVAVVKAGAFGIARVVYDVYGVEFAARLDLLFPLAVLAAITIIYGSVRALFQDELKKRLAYSTVSQVSYIALGIATVGPVATVGGIVHLVHQGVMKITLFFCAGNFAETLGIHHISEMHGVGRRMPWTMAAFTIGALGMIGVPPIAGFISKWYLAGGALEANQQWILLVLAGSSLLNAAYFLPILYVAWFKPQRHPWPEEDTHHRYETALALLIPPLFTAFSALLIGLLAATPFSPLEWAQLIAQREYR